jgi:hypothetical protein
VSVQRHAYLLSGRLQDVLALIQILGYGIEPDLTPREICASLQDVRDDQKPAEERLRHWEQVARAHPEFFRVSGKSASVSLAARFVAGKQPSGRILPAEVVQRLMQTAVDIYDREARRNEWWALYLPLIIAIIGAIGSFATALVSLFAAKR